MDFFEEFALFFRETDIFCIVCLVIGIGFCVLEIFLPARRLFAALGGLLYITGMVLRTVAGGSVQTVFIMAALAVFVILGAYMLMVVLTKSGWLRRQASPAAAAVKAPSNDYCFLLNLEGTAATEIKERGQILVNGVEFDAVPNSGEISAGAKIKVIAVHGKKIIVKEIR
ncbi:MAG: hypothetical protein LBS99_03930 [Clostridiales bacterium]|jgi:membrane-bound ClpP family serine protease|nr:hypothetical protein [Clostridiales bacterium]